MIKQEVKKKTNLNDTAKPIDISIIVKTFSRSICLENFLQSIEIYQKKYDIYFNEIIIIDDSLETYIASNIRVVNKYNMLNIVYKKYSENTIGLSRGRNIAMNIAKSAYILLCDDDFILDTSCDIESNLLMLQDKDLDILGGYFKNIDHIYSSDFSQKNWMGYFNDLNFMEQLIIYEDKFPKFAYCDMTPNFFLAKTSSVLRVLWSESVPPAGEHQEFFLRAKKASLKVAFTNNLFVRHLHLDNKDKTYSKYRNRKMDYSQNTPFQGVIITDRWISTFTDIVISDTKSCFLESQKKKEILYREGNKICFSFAFIEIKFNIKYLIQIKRKYKTK